MDVGEALFTTEQEHEQAVMTATTELRLARNPRLALLNQQIKMLLDQAVPLAEEAMAWERESSELGLRSEPWSLWLLADQLVPCVPGGTSLYAERITLLKDRGLL